VRARVQGRRRAAGAANPERRPPTRRSSSSSFSPPLRRQGLRADRAGGVQALLRADPPPPPTAAEACGRILHLRRRRLLLRRPASIHHALAPPSATPAAPYIHPRRPQLLLRLVLVSSCDVLRFELGRQDHSPSMCETPLRPRAVTVLTSGSLRRLCPAYVVQPANQRSTAAAVVKNVRVAGATTSPRASHLCPTTHHSAIAGSQRRERGL
jgi:hypothetical protein